MTDTVISSATREVVIGFDRPFVIIGERINPTGRKILAAEMAAGDFSRVEADALAQVAAGAHMLDVNAGIPLADEPAILARAIQLVQSITDVPLSIDSSIVAALRGRPRGLQGQGAGQLGDRRGGATGIGAAAGEEIRRGRDRDIQRRDRHLRRPGRALRGREEDRRARRRLRHSRDATSSSTRWSCRSARSTRPACRSCACVHRLRTELKVNTSCGASNVSFGLPNRDGINSAFLTMAIGAGMTSAITNPLHEEVVKAVMGADVMMGHDPDCARWIRRFREAPPPAAARRASRRGAARPPRGRAPPPARVAPGSRPHVDPRSPRRFHAFRQARPLCRGHAAAAGGARARRRHRFGLRRARPVRALPGAGRRGRIRQARRDLLGREPVPVQRARDALSRGASRWPPGRRLSCSARVLADVVIDVPATSQVHRQVVRKEADARAIELHPVVRLHYVQVQRAGHARSVRRPAPAVRGAGAEWELKDLTLRPVGAADAAAGLRAGDWQVTVAVHAAKQIIGVWPGLHETRLSASRSTSARRPSRRTCAI